MTTALVFDLDDTLYLEADFVRSGFAAVDRHLAAGLGIDGFFAEAWRLFESGRRGDIFDRALAALGHPATPELVGALVGVYRGHAPVIQLAPDAARALERWCPGGRVALLTDGYATTQERKIEALGLRQRCRPIVVTDVFGREYWKPHPRGFLALQEHFGLSGDELAYIADNPAKDFLAPRALGWKSIRIRRAGGLHAERRASDGEDAERTIRSLDELDSAELRGFLNGR